jgi:predicted NBD/HSP70 family sugar kinase
MHGHNTTTVKWRNRGMVLALLRRAALSRRQLAERLALQTSTISLITGELLAAGLVREQQRARAPRAVRPGRQEAPLELAPDGAYAIGIHLGIVASQIAVVNARGELLVHRQEPLPEQPTPAAVVRQLQRQIEQLALDSAIRERLIGVGLGVLAYVDPRRGIVRQADQSRWRDVPLAALLRQATGLPVLIEHNVRAMALAEQLYGRHEDLQNFAYLNVGVSIGAAIIVNGQLAEGHAYDSGQLGHLPVAANGPPCRCGRRGCLDTVASIRAIRQQTLALARQHPDSALARHLAGRAPADIRFEMLDLASAGEPLARACLDQAAQPLARVLAPVLAVLDPAAVIVSVGERAHDEAMIESLRPALAAHAARSGEATPLLPSSFGNARAVMGAATVALRALFDSPDLLPMLGSVKRET